MECWIRAIVMREIWKLVISGGLGWKEHIGEVYKGGMNGEM